MLGLVFAVNFFFFSLIHKTIKGCQVSGKGSYEMVKGKIYSFTNTMRFYEHRENEFLYRNNAVEFTA